MLLAMASWKPLQNKNTKLAELTGEEEQKNK